MADKKKKVVKKATKKSTKKSTKKVAKKPAKKAVKKATKKVTKKNTKEKEVKKVNTEKKVSKAHEEFEKKLMKDIGKYDSKTVDSGITDDKGNWDGSTMSDDNINKITNPHEKQLVIELDQVQEEIRALREDNDADQRTYISQLVQRTFELRRQLNEIDPVKYV